MVQGDSSRVALPGTKKVALALAATASGTLLSLIVAAVTRGDPAVWIAIALGMVSALLVFVFTIVFTVEMAVAVRARRAARLLPPAAPVPLPPPDPAVAAALAARRRRAESRQLIERDPLLAAELRIGRPDLAPDYDDGGLVDLNHAPAEAIARVCRIDRALAERIVAVRAGAPLLTVDDALTLADLPVDCWPRVRDRAVLISS